MPVPKPLLAALALGFAVDHLQGELSTSAVLVFICVPGGPLCCLARSRRLQVISPCYWASKRSAGTSFQMGQKIDATGEIRTLGEHFGSGRGGGGARARRAGHGGVTRPQGAPPHLAVYPPQFTVVADNTTFSLLRLPGGRRPAARAGHRSPRRARHPQALLGAELLFLGPRTSVMLTA